MTTLVMRGKSPRSPRLSNHDRGGLLDPVGQRDLSPTLSTTVSKQLYDARVLASHFVLSCSLLRPLFSFGVLFTHAERRSVSDACLFF